MYGRILLKWFLNKEAMWKQTNFNWHRTTSTTTTNNKLLIYKVILKPIWTYGIQLWGTISNSNFDILKRFQSKVLRLIVDALWYVSNSVIRKDLQIPTVKEEIS
jgi:hypothetical protein